MKKVMVKEWFFKKQFGVVFGSEGRIFEVEKETEKAYLLYNEDGSFWCPKSCADEMKEKTELDIARENSIGYCTKYFWHLKDREAKAELDKLSNLIRIAETKDEIREHLKKAMEIVKVSE